MRQKKYWLMKSEPSDYSFDDLKNEINATAEWDGVRNFQARNLLRDEIKVGDQVLFYHSNSKPSSFVGTAKVEKGMGILISQHGILTLTTLTPRARKKSLFGTWLTYRR
ncbi:MAG: hypothetical protein CM1200mP3_16810 [Chloroflexota bacterium]|nr:MAG: hypothetical protein CM1200mP3_16810 [Chloroflexota bacterium]